MADTRLSPQAAAGSNNFKEAVCIDAGRIYDSCSDKDCIDNLQVAFTDIDQPTIDQCTSVKGKKAEILCVFVDVEPVPFNRGFYAVDMTFFFKVTVDAFESPGTAPVQVEGLCVFQKKVILYGSEGGVKVFNSDDPRVPMGFDGIQNATNMPKASVQCVDPMLLSCRLVDCGVGDSPAVFGVLPMIARQFPGEFMGVEAYRKVTITLGLFSIVKLQREVQMLIPAYDFCVPDKECVSNADDPCEIFRRVKFPTDEFFPPRLLDIEDDC